jgi:transcriptional activator of cad operon
MSNRAAWDLLLLAKPARSGATVATIFPTTVGKIAADAFLLGDEPLMDGAEKTTLRVGAWLVNPATGEISRGGESVRLEARAMLLLLYLAERAGEVVSIEELLNRVWTGVIVSPDSVYQAVASLRRQLGDDPKQPTYIATVPRLGYRMVATVTRVDPDRGAPVTSNLASEGQAIEGSRIRAKWAVAVVVLIGIALVVVWSVLVRNRAGGNPPASSVLASQNQRSIAVLPFLDLTDGMKEEEFADGMTEELIDKLSRVPDFRVPGATASFYFKGKQVPVAEIAKTLSVAYVLERPQIGGEVSGGCTAGARRERIRDLVRDL